MTIEGLDVVTLSGFLYGIIVWMKRATGIGYKRFGPLSGREIDPLKSESLRRRSDRLVRDVERLERELRKIGFRIPPNTHHGD